MFAVRLAIANDLRQSTPPQLPAGTAARPGRHIGPVDPAPGHASMPWLPPPAAAAEPSVPLPLTLARMLRYLFGPLPCLLKPDGDMAH